MMMNRMIAVPYVLLYCKKLFTILFNTYFYIEITLYCSNACYFCLVYIQGAAKSSSVIEFNVLHDLDDAMLSGFLSKGCSLLPIV